MQFPHGAAAQDVVCLKGVSHELGISVCCRAVIMRASWDEFFMRMAVSVAQRGTCDRARVGCVLVSKFKSVIATGYNGSLPGTPHCDDVGHLMDDGGCIRTSHSESNAIAQAAREGRATDGATAYVTLFPCPSCPKCLVQAGVKRIVFLTPYRKMSTSLDLLKGTDVEVCRQILVDDE